MLFIWIIFTNLQCDFYTDQLKIAQNLEKNGDFEQALLEYKMMDKKFQSRIEIIMGYGRLYSLKRATLFAGLDNMEKAYLKNKDPSLWRDLILLYIAIQQYENALKLLQEPYLDLQKMFGQDAIRWRSGLACLINPGNYRLKSIKDLPEEHPMQNYFYILCALKLKNISSKEEKQILESWENLHTKSRVTSCELLNVLPDPSRLKGISVTDELAKCKKNYPSNLAIQRENMNDIFNNLTDQKIIFQQSRFESPDPGRDDVPAWPAGRIFEFSE